MSLMAIILWALYPLSPWRRLQELARHLLQVVFKNLTDQRTVDWLCANPDDPEGVPRIERCIDDLNAFTDFLVYQKARAILGLRPTKWIRPRPSPPQRRRTRTFSELYARFESCALRFADVERLAERRAETLKRLLDPPEVTLAEPAHTGFISEDALRDERNIASPIILFCLTAASRAPARHLAGLRVRAPP